MLPNMISSLNEILSHLTLRKYQMKPEERIREDNTKLSLKKGLGVHYIAEMVKEQE